MTENSNKNMYHSVMLSNLSRSDGSALLSSGETIVQAAVYGPTDIKVSKELYNKAVIDVTFKPKVGQSDCTERLIEYFIRNSFESTIISKLHPRTSINIIIQEIEDSGNMLACSINAVYLALLDAGIPMNGIVTAVSVGVFDDKIIPFPSQNEIKNAKCMATICIKNPDECIVGTKCSSFLEEDNFKKCITVAKKCAEDISQFFKESVEKRYLRTS